MDGHHGESNLHERRGCHRPQTRPRLLQAVAHRLQRVARPKEGHADELHLREARRRRRYRRWLLQCHEQWLAEEGRGARVHKRDAQQQCAAAQMEPVLARRPARAERLRTECRQAHVDAQPD
eukprot:5165088-Prymnesium_polylepis.1